VGDDWKSIQGNLNRVVSKVRRWGYQWEHAYSAEPNSRGTGNHAHSYVRSDVPHRILAQACAEEGIGTPQMKPYRRRGPASYAMKRARVDATRADHLALNGGRLLHNTNAFFRDRYGRPCSLAVATGRRRHPPDKKRLS